MSEVHANGRSILHKGDGLTQISGPPDVCKTPSPGGPVPIPYPNIAMDSDLAQATKAVKIGGNPVAHEGSNLRTSTGDEAGTAGGGIMSSKTKGKLTFGSSSIDVKFEGKGVARFMDVTHHNGNTFNTSLVAKGEVGYGDDPIDGEECIICEEAKSKHKLVPADDVVKKANDLRAALQDKNGAFAKAFVTKSGSATPLKKGVMIGVLSCQCEARKQYAGLAGGKYDDGQYKLSADAFEVEAGNLGLVPVVTMPTPPPRTGFASPTGPSGFGTISEPQWSDTLQRVAEAHNERGRGNPPLFCAAPKMIQKCLADGHKPGTLIEIWVSMKSDSTVAVSSIFGLVADRSTTPPTVSGEWMKNKEFGDGDTVPSCTTCQVICTGMVCRLGQPPCP
ncbi:DUF4150 domain-containing protein [Nannocystis punicea]|uniref:DUF4150 domain-containing protein n=1 Tax=Nannocystis punicea TaxID=2995304 RepID=A0ABY7H8Q1_9BACT|nr:DUF4150 domain-containing protein [Nannocystis poenicansa]WAS95632.1 DUF4150 domain-containing protein [Nannocystis poenicansa]